MGAGGVVVMKRSLTSGIIKAIFAADSTVCVLVAQNKSESVEIFMQKMHNESESKCLRLYTN